MEKLRVPKKALRIIAHSLSINSRSSIVGSYPSERFRQILFSIYLIDKAVQLLHVPLPLLLRPSTGFLFPIGSSLTSFDVSSSMAILSSFRQLIRFVSSYRPACCFMPNNRTFPHSSGLSTPSVPFILFPYELRVSFSPSHPQCPFGTRQSPQHVRCPPCFPLHSITGLHRQGVNHYYGFICILHLLSLPWFPLSGSLQLQIQYFRG